MKGKVFLNGMIRKFLILNVSVLLACFMTGCSSEDKSVVKAETNVPAAVSSFFNAEISNESYGLFHESPFFVSKDKTTHENLLNSNLCHVINSMEELEAVYQGGKEIPAINFNQYTLVLAKVVVSDTSWNIQTTELETLDSSYLLKVFVKSSGSGLQAYTCRYSWNLYPKLNSTSIQLEVVK